MNELTGKYYAPEEFIDYKADVERPLPMIYQSGYLTVKAYDRDFNTFLLDFPNNEVKNGFLTMLSAAYLQPAEETGGWIRSLVVALRRGDVEQMRTLFTSFLSSIPYTMRRKADESERERYFLCGEGAEPGTRGLRAGDGGLCLRLRVQAGRHGIGGFTTD